MPTMSDETVEKIAKLAALDITQEERAVYAEHLSNIFTLVDQMNGLNTEGIEPMAHAQMRSQPLRNDIVTEINERDPLQQLTPFHEAGLYLVNKVIE